MRYEIRLGGEGGQGIILAGIILAEAAIHDGRNAIQTQVYGPESRGGGTKAEVIISDEEIDYPKAGRIDLLLALTQEACNKYWGDLKEAGALIADSSAVFSLPSGGVTTFHLPILETAKEKVGRAVVANIVALGAVTAVSGVVSWGAMEKAVSARVPQGTVELNLNALKAGAELARASSTVLSAKSRIKN